MNIKIKCERCGVEKDLEIKVPKFCGNECRIANLKERMASKSIAIMTATSIGVAEALVDAAPEVTEGIPLPEVTEVPVETPLETNSVNLDENQTNGETGSSI